MSHRRSAALLATACLAATGIVAWGPGPTTAGPTPSGTTAAGLPADGMYPATGPGVVREDVSGLFTITVYPTTVVTTEDGPRIFFSYTAENASDQTLSGFTATIVLDEGLSQYLASDTDVPYDPAGVTIVPLDEAGSGTDSASGMDVRVAKLLTAPEVLASQGRGYADLAELAGQYTIELAWDGGGESYEVTAPITDPEGLLAD